MTKYELGLERLRNILGSSADEVIQHLHQISPDFINYIIEFAYGDIYAREGISDKTRELAAVANLIGQGIVGFPLKTHIQGMLNAGWSKNEIIEVIIYLIGYVGFPLTLEAMKTVHEVTEAHKITA